MLETLLVVAVRGILKTDTVVVSWGGVSREHFYQLLQSIMFIGL
jgi:hypothetical protein